MARIEWFGKAHFRDCGAVLEVRRGTLEEPVTIADVSLHQPGDSREPSRVYVSIGDQLGDLLDMDEIDALVAALPEQREHLAAEAADIAAGY